MASNVIILGAGASAQYGAPVMHNFLDVASNLYATGKTKSDKADHSKSFERVFQAIARLQPVHSKSELDLINLESVFTAFELSKTLNRFPGMEPKDIPQLIDDMKNVIVTTLQETLKFPIQGNSVGAHHGIENLVGALQAVPHTRGTPQVAILTFNYDLLVDMAIHCSGVGVDYGLAIQPDHSEYLPLLKLHGSLNWTTNTSTHEVVPLFLGKYFQRFKISSSVAPRQTKDVRIPIGDHLLECAALIGGQDGTKVDGIPVIVPPSWNKADSHRSISKVWSRAAAELSTASSIFVVGYSLPETDSFFRQLYALGSVGDTLLRRFWVFNPDESRDAVFRSMLGPGARERYRFFAKDAAEAFEHIAREIRPTT